MTLELDDVDVGYDGDPVVSGVSLRVDAGNVVALLGPNGAGKSTLLRTMLGLRAPLRGRVLLDGTPIGDVPRREVAKRVGYVPQHETPSGPSSVFDAVLMGRKPYLGWRPSRDDQEIVASVLDALDIADLAMRDVRELSGGQRQTVLLARALAQEPATLVLDEPTSDLDVRHQLTVLELLTEQAAASRGVVFAMHDLTLATRYADQIVLLADGDVLASGGPSVLTPERVERAFGVSVSVVDTDTDGPVLIPGEPVRDDDE